MDRDLKVIIGEDWQPKLLPHFAMALMGMMLITNVLNLKFVDVAGYSLLSSYLTYIFTLVLTDIMAEVYGYKRIKQLLYVGLGMLVFYGVVIEIVAAWPPAEGYANNAAFVTLFAQAPRLVTASVTAFFAVEMINSFVMSRLKVRFRARYFYGRGSGRSRSGPSRGCGCLFRHSLRRHDADTPAAQNHGCRLASSRAL